MGGVLITGASTGIGRACVDRLARDGRRVFATVRAPEDAAPLAAHPGDVWPLFCDVTDRDAIAVAAAQVAERCGPEGLDALINNAGIAVSGPLETLPGADLREQLEVNVVGQLAVTQAVLPLLRPAGGRIVFLGSIAGKAAVPYLGAYVASKYALEGLADALRIELRGSGVSVVLLEPGPVATPIWDKAAARLRRIAAGLPAGRRRTAAERAAERMRVTGEAAPSPARVAAAVARALSAPRPRTRYPVGALARGLYRIRPLIPDRAYDSIAARIAGRGG